MSERVDEGLIGRAHSEYSLAAKEELLVLHQDPYLFSSLPLHLVQPVCAACACLLLCGGGLFLVPASGGFPSATGFG